ncbi:MAG: hypothetical protein ACP5G4_04935, partial [bacterium]
MVFEQRKIGFYSAKGLIIGFLLITASAFAVFDGPVDWSASAGMASSAVSSGTKSFLGNPAGILDVQSEGASAGWRREWELEELSTGNIAGVMSREWGSAAIGGSFTGKSDFYT